MLTRSISILTFLIVFVFAANAQQWQNKLDAHFRLTLHNNEAVAGQGKKADVVYKAFILLANEENAQQLRDAGVRVQSVLRNIVTVHMQPDQVQQVASLPYVLKLELGKPVKLNNNRVKEHIGADKVYQGLLSDGNAYTGKGVLVGIYDSGIDFTHPDFRTPKHWNQSRLLYLWDQTLGVGTAPANFSYGTEWTGDQITSQLKGVATAQLSKHKDVIGHGTHVCGTAAGNKGIANESDIIFVKGSLDGNQTFQSLSTEIVDGVKYIYDRAVELNRPCVVNLSLGTHFGAPHDGSSLFETGLDNLVKSRSGFIVVVAAGNEGQDKIHVAHKGFVAATDSVWVQLSGTQGLGGGSAYMTFPGASRANIEVAFVADNINSDGSPAAQYLHSGWMKLSDLLDNNPMTLEVKKPNGDSQSKLDIGFDVFNASTDELLLALTEPFSLFSSNPCKWRIMFRGNVDMHGWVEGGLWNSAPSAALSFYTRLKAPDNISSVAVPATAKQVITVGAYTNLKTFTTLNGNQSWGDNQDRVEEGALAFFSSIGPTADGRTKPDIVAPGLNVISSLSKDAMATQPSHQVTAYRLAGSGTSMATPATVGAIALYLQKYPSATFTQVLASLRTNAIRDAHTAGQGSLPNGYWGYGKLDIFSMLNASLPLGTHNPLATASALLYPNPCSTQAHIRFDAELEPVKIELSDITGRVVSGHEISADDIQQNELLLDVSNLPRGFYMVHLYSATSQYTGKLRVD